LVWQARKIRCGLEPARCLGLGSVQSMDLQKARDWFEENFSLRGELGASVSLWDADGEILSLAGGHEDPGCTRPWTSQTPVLVWSATKGPAAACCLHALYTQGISPDERVRRLWPEFAAAGKGEVTFRMLLQHQAGLSALDQPPPVEDREAVVAALEKQAPAWIPGTAHGYHPRTFGFLADELVRRLTGAETLGKYWEQIFAGPMELEMWIGAPEEVLPRVAQVYGSKSVLPKGDPFMSAFMTPGSLTSRSFASPRGLHSAAAMNADAPRKACYPGFGGIATAGALAKFYAMLAQGGRWSGEVLLPADWVSQVAKSGVQGMDAVLQMETAFSLGFMRDPVGEDGKKMRRVFGSSLGAFGHPGAGGSLAFADPERRQGFAYVMNQMELGVLPKERAQGLVDALFGEPKEY
jgi:CubicO group peptidase (beta-lactamase class C family)